MCGIVGLYLKNPALEPELGRLFEPMLIEMTERGPDSAGVAVYHHPVGPEATKLTLFHRDHDYAWKALETDMEKALDTEASLERVSSHAVLTVEAGERAAVDWLMDERPEVQIVSIGRIIEIYKEMGLPAEVAEEFAVREMSGTHMIGHTRMATESAVTTAGSHPFSTGRDLCLVHNGSLSNHNRLRQWLKKNAGLRFQTDNDSEVAAGYLTHRLAEGDSLEQALEKALDDLDGFYTFAIGTARGFAVLRDPIACKPAVMAETDDWVAMASEFRSLAKLPGVGHAAVWEPEPAQVYTWGSA